MVCHPFCERTALALADRLHGIFYSCDCCHSVVVCLVHIAGRIAWGIAFKLTFVERLDKLVDGILLHLLAGKAVGNIVVRQFCDGNIQLVAHISPQRTKHFIVEFTLLLLLHQAVGYLESLGSHLVGLLTLTFHDVGILNGTTAEHDEQRDKQQQEEGQQHPIARTSKEEVVDVLMFPLACFQRMDVLILFLGIVDGHTATTLSFLYIQFEGLRLDGPIGIGIGVVIDELYWRNGVFALVSGHGKEVVDHVTLHAIGSQLRLVGDFRVVFVKVFREIHYRLLNEFQVSCTAYHHTNGDGFIGFYLVLVELAGDVETSYATREIIGLVGQRVHLNGDAWRLDATFHFNVAASTVEESFEGIHIAVLLNHRACESDAGNLQLSCHLWEHHVLAPGDATVVPAVDILDMERLLLGQFHLLRMESRQVGHLSLELSQVNERVDLVGQHDGFLFMNAAFVGTHFDEKVAAADGRPCLTHLMAVVLIVVHLRR